MLSPFRFIAPPHSPFRADGQLNLDAVASQVRLLEQHEVDGAFVAGTTGEVSSLTLDERKTLVEKWCDAAGDSEIEVIVQVGHNCQADACDLARHAQSAGADAVAAFAPSYFKPAGIEELVEFLVPVAAASGDLPFYFYDIPGMTGVRVPTAQLLSLAKERIPNLVGLKFSNNDLVTLQECVRINDGEFEVLFGSDEVLLAGVAFGIAGAVGSTYNFATPLYRNMLAAFAAGNFDAARMLQARAVSLFRVLERFGYLAASKALMAMLGVDCGPVRTPLRNLAEPQIAELRRQLETLGFFRESFFSESRSRVSADCEASL
jgi:N-acetylneuraminate lyase